MITSAQTQKEARKQDDAENEGHIIYTDSVEILGKPIIRLSSMTIALKNCRSPESVCSGISDDSKKRTELLTNLQSPSTG